MPVPKRSRTSSALLSAAAGGAVCLSGGGVARAVTGNIASSNGGFTSFYGGLGLRAFASQAQWLIGQNYTLTTICTPTTNWTTTTTTTTATHTTTTTTGGGATYQHTHKHYYTHQNPHSNPGSDCTSFLTLTGPAYLNSLGNDAKINGSYSANAHSAGVTINSALPDGFGNHKRIPAGKSDKYIAVQFDAGGTKYGWLHLVGTCSCGQIMFLDKWGYDATGGDIRTLAPSVTTRTLPLKEGRLQLHWNNKNEAGIARYEIQSQDALGNWTALATEAPGAGRYNLTMPAAGTYRVVVERTDGSTETAAF